MLLAYLDEVGDTGAFVSLDHKRFNISPAFGYAGFVVPEKEARKFGAKFTEKKRQLFRKEMEAAGDRSSFEKKGSDLLRKETPQRFPQYLRVLDSLIHELCSLHKGNLFYYVKEKPIGTDKETALDVESRERSAMEETLNRLARYSNNKQDNVLVIMDQVNEKQRKWRTKKMYAHIFSRQHDFPEMRRIIEPPMHVDSSLSSNIQFSDWIAALVGRAVQYQLVEDSAYGWVTDRSRVRFIERLRAPFVFESKLHLCEKAIGDLNNADVFLAERPVFRGLNSCISEEQQRKMTNLVRMRKVAEASRKRNVR